MTEKSNHLDIERQYYGYFCPISTRWMDNDIYGHVNNVTYYSYFDSAANQYLIEKILLARSFSTERYFRVPYPKRKLRKTWNIKATSGIFKVVDLSKSHFL